MIRVLGIDPGSRVTGYGVVDVEGNQTRFVDCGCIDVSRQDFPYRLRGIFDGMSDVLERMRPDAVAIEKVFVQRNVDSALKLGQARGAAICAVLARELTLSEYSPTEIKQAIVGRGRAEKQQVVHMVSLLLGIQKKLREDAADALACALCHVHITQTQNRLMTQQVRR